MTLSRANQANRAIFLEKFRDIFWPWRPLKIGIHQELIAAAPEIPARLVLLTLRIHTAQFAYLRTLVTGAERIGLNGQHAGTVTEEEAAHARQKLVELSTRRREKDQRRKATQQAQRLGAAKKAAQQTVAPVAAATTTKALRERENSGGPGGSLTRAPAPAAAVRLVEPPPALPSTSPPAYVARRHWPRGDTKVPVVIIKRRR